MEEREYWQVEGEGGGGVVVGDGGGRWGGGRGRVVVAWQESVQGVVHVV